MKKLRSGYTTGACAAAAAKGAALFLVGKAAVAEVEIPFPNGSRVAFALSQCGPAPDESTAGFAMVIKDAGDDPDVTNGAEICATVSFVAASEVESERILIRGGTGVGTITKPGLAMPVGSPAINPVPLKMIRAAVAEALGEQPTCACRQVEVEISVPRGEELAAKTLNGRLGIIGGLSILGSTGIVRPISAEAWTATITASMNVATAQGISEIVLSTGRTSEAALERTGKFRPEALVMMGDYLEFALQEAGKYPFSRLHLAGMWAKIVKAGMRIPQTHVRFGALEVAQATEWIATLVPETDLGYLQGANTAREIYERLVEHDHREAIRRVCLAARKYHEELSGLPVCVYLVHHNGRIVMTVE